MKLASGDRMIDMSVVDRKARPCSPSPKTATASAPIPDQFREQGRNGKGMIAMKLTDKTGPLVAQLTVYGG